MRRGKEERKRERYEGEKEEKNRKNIERKRNASEEENIFRFFVVRQVYSIL